MGIKKKILISVTIVLSIIGLIVYFIIWPTIKDIKTINYAVYLERLDLEKKYQKGQLLRTTIENFEKIKPEQDKLKNVFVIEGQELEFITSLEQIAEKNQVDQELKLATSDDVNRPSSYSLPLTLKINGSFIGILKYLRDLENLDYYFSINSITLDTESTNRVTDDHISAILSGNIYVITPLKKEI